MSIQRALAFFAVLIAIAVIRMVAVKVRDRRRGWRVGGGRMHYDELRDGAWHRIEIDSERLVGTPRCVIYTQSIKWPAWAQGRSAEIVARIKNVRTPPEYAYDDGTIDILRGS